MKKQFHVKDYPLTTKPHCILQTFDLGAPWTKLRQPHSSWNRFKALSLTNPDTPQDPTSPHNRSTLRKLGSNANLVIKPFDKGSEICLLDTTFYINKIEEHLANSTTYKELNSDPTQAIRNDPPSPPSITFTAPTK